MSLDGPWKKLVLLVSLLFSQVPIVQAQFKLETYSMGTYWRIRADFINQSFSQEFLDKKIISILDQYDSTFSDWRKNSELEKLLPNMTKWQNASPLFLQGLTLAQYFYNRSHQQFDISIGAVLKNLKKRPVGLDHLLIKGHKFRFIKHPGALTFNGFVKGMAVGQIVKYLEKLNIKSYFIDGGGGNIALKGDSWGAFHSYTLKNKNSIYFISKSALYQGKRKHIIGANENEFATTLCESKKDPIFVGALSDTLSTLKIITKDIPKELSKNCLFI